MVSTKVMEIMLMQQFCQQSAKASGPLVNSVPKMTPGFLAVVVGVKECSQLVRFVACSLFCLVEDTNIN